MPRTHGPHPLREDDFRLDLPALLRRYRMSAYGLAKRSGGRISVSTAYRLADPRSRETALDLKTITALVDVFGLTRFDQLFVRGPSGPESLPAPESPAASAARPSDVSS